MTTSSALSPVAKRRGDKQLWLKPGEKMLFAGGTKGLALDVERLRLKVVDGDDPAVIVHDPKNKGIAAMLIEMPESFPVALGVIYEDPAPTFESAVVEQNAAAASGKTPDLQKLVSQGPDLAGRKGTARALICGA